MHGGERANLLQRKQFSGQVLGHPECDQISCYNEGSSTHKVEGSQACHQGQALLLGESFMPRESQCMITQVPLVVTQSHCELTQESDSEIITMREVKR
eukprot:2910467-Amphidinium_carterae.3